MRRSSRLAAKPEPPPAWAALMRTGNHWNLGISVISKVQFAFFHLVRVEGTGSNLLCVGVAGGDLALLL